ncbi:hypothetical protein EON81_16010 [bacterium]|nr:MAG: hypothetical protein EON81_16010 [bacterium]
MLFGKGAWTLLLGTSLGAIAWTEAMMAAIRSGSQPLMNAAAIGPFLLGLVLLVVWRIRHPFSTPKEEESVAMRLTFKGARVFLDRGRLRRDGGILVFKGTKTEFAIGHDALLERPINLIGDYGAKLKDAPEGTRLALRGEPRLIREWAKDTSEPTRTRVPLLVMPDPEGPPKGWLANYLLFALACVLTGALIGGYIDFRGYSPVGKSLLGLFTFGMAGAMALVGFAMLSTKNEGKGGRALARKSGFHEAEPWRPTVTPTSL